MTTINHIPTEKERCHTPYYESMSKSLSIPHSNFTNNKMLFCSDICDLLNMVSYINKDYVSREKGFQACFWKYCTISSYVFSLKPYVNIKCCLIYRCSLLLFQSKGIV